MIFNLPAGRLKLSGALKTFRLTANSFDAQA
jgi:hypothetical protein